VRMHKWYTGLALHVNIGVTPRKNASAVSKLLAGQRVEFIMKQRVYQQEKQKIINFPDKPTQPN
jgi:hypothetical protein